MGTKDYLGELVWNQTTSQTWWFLCKSPRSTIKDRIRFWSKINRRKIPISSQLAGIDEMLVPWCEESLGEDCSCWDHGKMKVGGEISQG